MGSQDRAVREKQLEKAQAELDAHKSVLAQRGLDERAMKKDAQLRGLVAKLKKAKARITAADARAAHVAEMAAKNTKLEKETAKDKKGGGKKSDGKKGDGEKADKGEKGDKGGGKKGK